MLKRMLLAGLLAMAASSPAMAKSTELMLKILVLDEANEPVSTASVRSAQEAEKHGVNANTGAWEGSVLYLADGSEVKFVPDMPVEFEISAPGYVTQKVAYVMRKRKNVIKVNLGKITDAEDTDEDVDINFGRDKPREK
jgi:hypothetical protein